MKIYLDIILFENLCMNYIILYVTGIILKRKIKHIRLIISSLVGSLYAIIIYLKIANIASNIIMKIILSVAMIGLAYNENNFKSFFKNLIMFYMISFVFGGCSIALIYFINPSKVKMENGVLVGMYPIKVTLLASIVAFMIIQVAFKITKNKLSTEDMICSLEIFLDSKRVRLRTLIDSGNMLHDPISNDPVIIVEMDKIKNILPENFIDSMNVIEGGEFGELSEKLLKLRLIPFFSVGKQNGMLVGIKVDKVKIEFKEKENYINNVIIGIYNKQLTKENKYNALMGLELLDKYN